MNAKFLSVALAFASLTGSAQVVGYVNLTFQPGANWFGNPLLSTAQGGDSLSTILPTAPDGTTVSLWDPTVDQFTTTSTFSDGAWSANLVIDPGTGALLNTPSQFVNTFTGAVENFDGSPLPADFAFVEPPAFSGPNGVYFLSSQAPVVLSGDVFNPSSDSYPLFLSILGRAPNQGEQVTTLNALTQTYTTTTFLNGSWNNGDPTLAIGEAAMINIGPVPEPSSLALMLAGLATVIAIRRRQVSRA